jgi:hypothetical protein
MGTPSIPQNCNVDKTNGNNQYVCFNCEAKTPQRDTTGNPPQGCSVCFNGINKDQVNNYPFYNSNWTNEKSLNPVSSVSAESGHTYVSLAWTPSDVGFTGGEVGYVVKRSLPGASKPPQDFDSSDGSNIVYVGTGTYFGDRPLSHNTPDLMTADAGLIPNTYYWYSVFVVSKVNAPSANDPAIKFSTGSYSSPVSIKVKTKDLPQITDNLITEDITSFNPNNSSGWMLAPGSSTSSFSGAPYYQVIKSTDDVYVKDVDNIGRLNGLDPNDPTIKDPLNSKNLIFTEFLRVLSPDNSCNGFCDGNGTCNAWGGGVDPNDTNTCSASPYPSRGTPCDCSNSSSTGLTIYQTIKGPDNGYWTPGKLYSISLWFRTNNPISAAAAVNGNDQAYTPVVSVVGLADIADLNNNKRAYNGIIQIEQTLINETSPGIPVPFSKSSGSGSSPNPVACDTTDTKNCAFAMGPGGSSPQSNYSMSAGVWQRASLSFTIGSKNSTLKSPSTVFNISGGRGDPVQFNGTDVPEDYLQDLLLTISVAENVPGVAPGVGKIDLAKVELYEGLIPYTDPYWYLEPEGNSPGKNLIINPDINGVVTDFQGTYAAGWVFGSAYGLASDNDACASTCSGGCLVCKDTKTGAIVEGKTCQNTCSTGICVQGVCQPDSTGVEPSGSCVGNCTGINQACVIDTTYTCTGVGTCTGTCSVGNSGASCVGDSMPGGDSSKTCGGGCAGTCSGECVFTPPSCHAGGPNCSTGDAIATCKSPPGPCYAYTDVSNKAQCLLLEGGFCGDSYEDLTNYVNSTKCVSSCTGNYINPPFWTCNNGTGSCEGTCIGTCKSVCSEQNGGTCDQPIPSNSQTAPSCAGTCTGNGGSCSGGSGSSCAGGAVCFNTTLPEYENVTDVSGLCSSETFGKLLDVDKSVFNGPSYFVMHGCCQGVNLQQGNIWGLNGYYMSSIMLYPGDTYELSFDYAVLENQSSNNVFTVLIADMTTTITLFEDDIQFEEVPPNQPTYQFQTYSSLSPTTKVKVKLSSVPTSQDGFPIFFNPNIRFSIGKDNYITIAIKNLKLVNTSRAVDMYGLQNQFPAIPTVPYTTSSRIQQDAIIWTVPNTVNPTWSETVTTADCPQSVLFNLTAHTPSGDELGWPHGLVLMSGFHTAPTIDMSSIVQDNDPDLQKILGTETNKVIALNVENTNGYGYANQSAFLMSNSYYGSGQWDIWVKLANVYDGKGNPMTEMVNSVEQPVDPQGCSFAYWVYHALSYEVSGGARLWNEPNPLRNSEIDIEMNGACPDYSQNYNNQTARLNGWGGQWGGSGANFTMHTRMPNNLNLNDGKYHKLSIIFHSGYDLPSNEIDPNSTEAYPEVRKPGFVKWLVDDIEWGCGWMGNSYGQDNIPMTAMRLVAGPWNPDWAGCSLCCGCDGPDASKEGYLCNYGSCTANDKDVLGCQTCNGCNNTNAPGGCCPPASALSMPPEVPQPTCNVWSEAVFYVAKLQYTPTCIDCTSSNTDNPGNSDWQSWPWGNTTYDYVPSASSPSRPDPTLYQNADPTKSTCTKCVASPGCGIPGQECTGICKDDSSGTCATPSIIPASNRNRWLPETKPYLTFTVNPPTSQ